MGLLDGLLGGGGARRGGPSPIALGLIALLAYNQIKGKNLGSIFGGNNAGAPQPGGAPGDSGQGGLGGLLGGLTGAGGLGGLLGGMGAGGLGGLLSGGLGDLVKQFQQQGQGDAAESWVSKGDNKPVTPSQIETALGEEKIAWLMQQTGMSRDELLAGLSREMPKFVDQLTPDGRIPTPQEAQRLA